jgi:hypothetical protein
MTNTQVVDNLMFIAALQQLTVLAAKAGMTEQETEKVKKELERRLRPTLIPLN